jgi:hypothetical protein
MSEENNHLIRKTGSDVPFREDDGNSFSNLLVQFISVLIASPVLLTYAILCFITYVLKISYRDSLFNEFGRRIVYVKNEFKVNFLQFIVSDSRTDFIELEYIDNDDAKTSLYPFFKRISGRVSIQSKDDLYKYLRLFVKVGVFNYNKNNHAKLKIIDMDLNILTQLDTLQSEIKAQKTDDNKFEWTDEKKKRQTQEPDLWLLLVDKKPLTTDFESIGILTGSSHFQLKHTEDEAKRLFVAYGFNELEAQPEAKPNKNKPKRILSNFRYKANRALSRVKRGFQAKVLRQQVQLSKTRTRTKAKGAEKAENDLD